MTANSIHSQSQRAHHGPISSKLFFKGKGVTREQYTADWEDIPWMGVLYWLHKKGKEGKKLEYKELANLTRWGWRTVKNMMNKTLLTSPLKSVIKKQDVAHCKNQYYIENPSFLELSFEHLCRIVRADSFSANNVPNKCETLLLKWLDEMYPNLFKWGGHKKLDKYDGLAPDIVCIEYPITIDHFGRKFHEECQCKPRIKRLNVCGMYALIIWENELKNENTCKMKLKEFIDDAIQDIQQLAV